MEHALSLAEKWDAQVIAATVGPAEADEMLKDALAAGATGAAISRFVAEAGEEPSRFDERRGMRDLAVVDEEEIAPVGEQDEDGGRAAQGSGNASGQRG